MINENGVINIDNFLSANQIDILNTEINEISYNYLINGNSKASVWINHNQFEILNPIVNIESINILNIAFKIYKKLQSSTGKNYTLSSLRIIDEKKNIHPLNWHTDNTNETIRGLLYLIGGDINNGSLGYVKESHNLKYENNKTHNLDISELNLQSKVLNFESKPGDLVLLNINGIHKKNKINNHRRIIFFEFQQQKKSIKKKTKIIFDNSKISSEILNEPDFLFYENDEKNLIPPIHHSNLILETPIKIFGYYFKSFFKLQFKKILKKLRIDKS
jgi:hypothetical protein